MSQFISNMLEWYQARIGSHDKQSWEKSLDDQLLRNNLYCVPKKSTKIDDVLIDIDLVKGSTFTKTKSKMSIFKVFISGFTKLIFYPFYFKWWQYQTSKLFAFILLFVYLLQISNFAIYNLTNSKISNNKQYILINEIATPSLIMIILGIMYTYITSAIPNNAINNINNSSGTQLQQSTTHAAGENGAEMCQTQNQSDIDRNKKQVCSKANKRSTSYCDLKAYAASCTYCDSVLASKTNEDKQQLLSDNEKIKFNYKRNGCVNGMRKMANGGVLRKRFVRSLSNNNPAGNQVNESETANEENEELRVTKKRLKVEFQLLNENKVGGTSIKSGRRGYRNQFGAADSGGDSENVDDDDDFDDDEDEDEDDFNDQFDDTVDYACASRATARINQKNSGNDFEYEDEDPAYTSSSFSLSNSEHSAVSFDDSHNLNNKQQLQTSDNKQEKTLTADEGRTEIVVASSLATPLSNKSFENSSSMTMNGDDEEDEDDDDDENNNTNKLDKALMGNFFTAYKSDKTGKQMENAIKDSSENNKIVRIQEQQNTKLDNNNNTNNNTGISLNNHYSAAAKKISCLLWESNEWKGADLTVLEISNCIISNVKDVKFKLDYFYVGIVFSLLISSTPLYFYNCRTSSPAPSSINMSNGTQLNESKQQQSNYFELLQPFVPNIIVVFDTLLDLIRNVTRIDLRNSYIITNTLASTFILCILFFSLLTIAERTLNQRFLHAKYFCSLTSNRKARKYNLPHFRLNKVENIRTWLSVRSYMRRKGPQRSIDAIISSTFLIGVGLLSIVCIRFLQDADFLSESLLNWQLVIWSLCIWTFMLRFMTIGFKINKKYRNCMSTVITEQINLYLQMEKMPERKDELTVVNNVLKLASDLLKEVEGPFKISGLGVDPWVYNVTKVVILSAFSAVLSELFGFKLKLYKIKIR